MRLAQLARKTSLRPDEIVEFLTAKGVTIETDPNTKLDEDQVSIIINHFAPHLVEQVASTGGSEAYADESGPASIASTHEPVESLPSLAVPLPIVPLIEPSDKSALDADEQKIVLEPAILNTAEVELIKAPKVALTGLKVLGKIELPEVKKKEIEKVEATETETPTTSEPLEKRPRVESRKNLPRTNVRRDGAPRKNPIATQREAEARAAEERRKEEARLAKDRRTQFYQQRVKPVQPTKSARLYNEPTETSVSETKAQPTSWLGRFWNWFRS